MELFTFQVHFRIGTNRATVSTRVSEFITIIYDYNRKLDAHLCAMHYRIFRERTQQSTRTHIHIYIIIYTERDNVTGRQLKTFTHQRPSCT